MESNQCKMIEMQVNIGKCRSLKATEPTLQENLKWDEVRAKASYFGGKVRKCRPTPNTFLEI